MSVAKDPNAFHLHMSLSIGTIIHAEDTATTATIYATVTM